MAGTITIVAGGAIRVHQTAVTGTIKLSGAAGPPGLNGAGSLPTSDVQAGENIAPGAPVRIDTVTGLIRLASASAIATATVLGIPDTAALTGFICSAQIAKVTLSNWTAITGAASLLPGQTYFLGLTAGTLTLAPPTSGGQCIVKVGIAQNSTTLVIEITQPMLL
jgi:hypothetical protein